MVIEAKEKAVISDRVARLKQSLIEAVPRLSCERIRCLLESYRETEGQPPSMRRARVFEKLLGEMTIFIDENPIVGVDFDPTGNSPLNWNTITTAGSTSLINLTREDGSISPYDLSISHTGGSANSSSVAPANLPTIGTFFAPQSRRTCRL